MVAALVNDKSHKIVLKPVVRQSRQPFLDAPIHRYFILFSRKKTPIGKLDEQPTLHPAQEKEPLPAWPDNKNPHTGNINRSSI